jgi:hypothetical protein
MNNMQDSDRQKTPGPETGTRLGRFRRAAPTLFFGLAFLLAAELLAIIAGPLLLPHYLYLRMYLGETARASTSRLLSGQDQFLMYDSVLGWRSRPNAQRGKWQTDSLGSRTSHPFAARRTTPLRILFLGNSVTNGGMSVSVNETISAFVEDSSTEALNFATMLYALDQDYLSYVSGLYQLDANVIVVGLQGTPGRGLDSRYVPFLNRDEVNMPFLKPAFVMSDTGLTSVPLPPKDYYDRILEGDDILDSLRVTDQHWSEFSAYEHFGLTPVSRGIWQVIQKIKNLTQLLSGQGKVTPLTQALMRQMVQEAGKHGSSVIFMILPERSLAFPARWRAFFADHYDGMITDLRTAGFTIFDGRRAFRDSGIPPARLYYDDGVHFSTEGNRIVAKGLKSMLSIGLVQPPPR